MCMKKKQNISISFLSEIYLSTYLLLPRFTDSETYIEDFFLQVVIVDPDCSIIQLGPKSLTVGDFYSLSDHLDNNVVSFHYERSSTLVCSIILTSQDTYLPAHGQLVTGESVEATSSSQGKELITEKQTKDDYSSWGVICDSIWTKIHSALQ